MITGIVDFIVGGLFTIIALMIGLLPDFSVLDYIDVSNPLLVQGLGWLNWFVPVSDIVAISSIWLACLVFYQGYMIFSGYLFKFLK